jgi:hypothetical protein
MDKDLAIKKILEIFLKYTQFNYVLDEIGNREFLMPYA